MQLKIQAGLRHLSSNAQTLSLVLTLLVVLILTVDAIRSLVPNRVNNILHFLLHMVLDSGHGLPCTRDLNLPLHVSRKPWKKPFLTLTTASYILSMMMLSSKGPHLVNIIRMFQVFLLALGESGFTLNTLKYNFFQNTLPYLGHNIDHGQIRLDPSRVEAIVNLPPPKNPKTLKEFLGMAQFCDCLVPQYSLIAAPLHDQPNQMLYITGLQNVKMLLILSKSF